MTRSLGRRLLLAAFWLLATGTVQAGDCSCKQWMGCGYGPGYNAPVPPGGGCANNGMLNNWGRGCCEVPASWRLGVWDGYHGDPATYQRSLIGAQPDVNHAPKAKVYGGPGILPGDSATRTNCLYQDGSGSYGNPTMVPTTAPTPLEFQPGTPSSQNHAWSRF